MIKELLDKTLLKDSLEFKYSISELRMRMQDKQKLKSLEWTSEITFEVKATFSLGTLMFRGFPGAIDGIKVFGELNEMPNEKSSLSFTTKIRPELYFITAIPVLSILVSLLTDKETPLWSFFLFPLFTFWFWLIYRVQEIFLMNKVKKQLRII